VAQPTGFQTTLVGGFDGTALRALLTDQAGSLGIAGGAALTDGSKSSALGIGVAGSTSQSWPLCVGVQLFDGAALRYARVPSKWTDVNAVAVVAGVGFTAWTPGAGKKFRLMGYALSSSAAAAIIFGDNAVGTVLHRTPLLAAAGVFAGPPMGNGQLSAAANNVLKIDVSVNSTLTGFLFGTEE
jgi:hypothetical protein